MDETIQDRVDESVELYERVSSKVQDPAVVAAIIEQVGKDTRCEWMMAERSNGNGAVGARGDEPATQKQLGFLAKLGVDVPEGCTKRQASRLIDEAQSNSD